VTAIVQRTGIVRSAFGSLTPVGQFSPKAPTFTVAIAPFEPGDGELGVPPLLLVFVLLLMIVIGAGGGVGCAGVHPTCVATPRASAAATAT
jgi:hypothetical protein